MEDEGKQKYTEENKKMLEETLAGLIIHPWMEFLSENLPSYPVDYLDVRSELVQKLQRPYTQNLLVELASHIVGLRCDDETGM